MLEVKNLVKVYKTKGGVETRALDDVSVNFPETGLVFLLGKSGSGKSTLLNMIGGLDQPDSGEIIVKGRSSKDFSQSDFDSYRNTFIGFIFQEYNVLNEFNIEQNIALALQLQGKKNDKEAVNDLLKEVDLEGFNKRKPNTLSGGQKQRIAIARALIKNPEIIMADEPTGALDSTTGKQVLETLKKLSKDKLVIIVSHDQDFAEEYGDRIIELKDGKILTDKSKEHVPPQEVNKNIQVINGNVIDIKKGSELTEADFKQLYQLIKKQDKEVLISTGEHNVKVTKKAQRISEDGKGEVFNDTKEVPMKQYDGKETKFIRSRMPFSRSFKMGVSGLKTKPIRLIFTILLSVVSFTMFGVASTLMFYDPAYSLAGALEKMDRTSEAVAKEYKFVGKSVTIDNSTGEVIRESNPSDSTSKTYFGVQEVRDLNAQNNNRFLGVYTLTNDNGGMPFQLQGIAVGTDAKDYYSYNGFTGLSDATAEQFTAINAQLTGTHPTAGDEIAISNYTFDLIKESNALGTLTDKNAIIGKTIDLYFYGKNWMSYTQKMKITGVYDFGAIPQTYDGLKQAKEASVSQKERDDQVGLFKNFLGNSVYTTGYVAPAFYDAYGYVPSDNSGNRVERVWPRGITWSNSREDLENRPVNNDNNIETYIYEDLKVSGTVTYYDRDFKELSAAPTLTDNDVLLPYSQYYINVLREKYYAPVSNFRYNLESHQNLFTEAEYQEFQLLNNYDESIEGTTPWGQAYLRLRNSFNKGGSEFVYPAGYDIDEDFAAINTGFNNLYKECTYKSYLRSAFSGLQSYYDNNGLPIPEHWEDYVAINSKFDDRSITNEEITQFNTYISGLFTDLGTDADYVLKAVRGEVLYEAFSNNVRLTVENKFRELYPDKADLYYIMNNYASSHEDAEFVGQFDTIYTFAYKLIKGESAAVTFEYKPDFVGDYVDVEAPASEEGKGGMEGDVIAYLTKDVAGTIKEYNVVGFYNITGDSSSYGTAVLNRNAVKNYLKDSYSWRNIIETDYQAPADAKYAYVIAANTSYNQADVALFTKNFGSYNYTMTNSVYKEVSASTNMITQLKTIFLIIGAVTGALAGLLLLNFISVSISSKNKDIGILRAVGARGSDVFKIFFSESSVITLICFVLSAVATGFVCSYLNTTLSNSMVGVKLLNFGVINVLLILGVGIVISFIATFIPVMIAAKKPPVEAIRAL